MEKPAARKGHLAARKEQAAKEAAVQKEQTVPRKRIRNLCKTPCHISHLSQVCSSDLAHHVARDESAGCSAKRETQAKSSQASLILLLFCLRLQVNRIG
jgi:hypothetical protein